MSPDPTTEKGKMTMQAIIQAAGELFFSGNYHSVKTEDIAKRAEEILNQMSDEDQSPKSVSKATVFYHFKSKEELALAVLRSYMDMLDNLADEKDIEQSDDPLESLRVMFSQLLNEMFKDPGVIMFMMQLMNDLKIFDNYTSSKSSQDFGKMQEDPEAVQKANLGREFGEYFDNIYKRLAEVFRSMGIVENAEDKVLVLLGMMDGIGLHLYFRILMGEDITTRIDTLVDECISIIGCWQKQR